MEFSNHIYPDYPCIAYGDNLVADPYMKCDLVTWTSGTYSTGWPYVNIYGFEQLAADGEALFPVFLRLFEVS